jgi:hypothetical protein
MLENKLLINKAFMSKSSAFKILLNQDKEVFFQIGKIVNDSWDWKKAKINQTELGEIISFIQNKTQKECSFMHKFKKDGKETISHIGITRNDNPKFPNTIYINNGSRYQRTMSNGELQILRVLLERIIIVQEWKIS